MLRTRLAVLSEHDPDARARLSGCLRHHGLECIEVATLPEGLDLCARRCPDVLIVLLDGSSSSLRMVEVLSRHHQLVHTPIIALSPHWQSYVPGAWRVLPSSADHDVVLDSVFDLLELQTALAR